MSRWIDAAAVRALERVRQLGENPVHLRSRDASLETQPLGERRAADVAHDEVPDPAHLAEGVQRHDARMRELRGDPRLAPEPLATSVRLGQLGAQHLDRDEALERALAREIDGAHAALAERPHDLVLLAERQLERAWSELSFAVRSRDAEWRAPARPRRPRHARPERSPNPRPPRAARASSSRIAGSPAQAASRKSPRSCVGRSIASAKSAFTRCQRASRHVAPELAAEPGARERPLALHRRRGDVERFRRLLDGESAEIAQLDEPRLIGIERRESLERLVQARGDRRRRSPARRHAPRRRA